MKQNVQMPPPPLMHHPHPHLQQPPPTLLAPAAAAPPGAAAAPHPGAPPPGLHPATPPTSLGGGAGSVQPPKSPPSAPVPPKAPGSGMLPPPGGVDTPGRQPQPGTAAQVPGGVGTLPVLKPPPPPQPVMTAPGSFLCAWHGGAPSPGATKPKQALAAMAASQAGAQASGPPSGTHPAGSPPPQPSGPPGAPPMAAWAQAALNLTAPVAAGADTTDEALDAAAVRKGAVTSGLVERVRSLLDEIEQAGAAPAAACDAIQETFDQFRAAVAGASAPDPPAGPMAGPPHDEKQMQQPKFRKMLNRRSPRRKRPARVSRQASRSNSRGPSV